MRRVLFRLAAPTVRALSTRSYGPMPVRPQEAIDLVQRLSTGKAEALASSAVEDYDAAPDVELMKCLHRLAVNKQSDLAWRLYTNLATAKVSLDKTGYTGFVKAVGSIGKEGLAKRAKQIEEDLRTAGAYDPLDEDQVIYITYLYYILPTHTHTHTYIYIYNHQPRPPAGVRAGAVQRQRQQLPGRRRSLRALLPRGGGERPDSNRQGGPTDVTQANTLGVVTQIDCSSTHSRLGSLAREHAMM